MAETKIVAVRRPSSLELLFEAIGLTALAIRDITSLVNGAEVSLRNPPRLTKWARFSIGTRAGKNLLGAVSSVTRMATSRQVRGLAVTRGNTRFINDIRQVDDQMLAWDAGTQLMRLVGALVVINHRKSDRRPNGLGIAVALASSLRPTYTLTIVSRELYRRHGTAYLDAGRRVLRGLIMH